MFFILGRLLTGLSLFLLKMKENYALHPACTMSTTEEGRLFADCSRLRNRGPSSVDFDIFIVYPQIYEIDEDRNNLTQYPEMHLIPCDLDINIEVLKLDHQSMYAINPLKYVHLYHLSMRYGTFRVPKNFFSRLSNLKILNIDADVLHEEVFGIFDFHYGFPSSLTFFSAFGNARGFKNYNLSNLSNLKVYRGNVLSLKTIPTTAPLREIIFESGTREQRDSLNVSFFAQYCLLEEIYDITRYVNGYCDLNEWCLSHNILYESCGIRRKYYKGSDKLYVEVYRSGPPYCYEKVPENTEALMKYKECLGKSKFPALTVKQSALMVTGLATSMVTTGLAYKAYTYLKS